MWFVRLLWFTGVPLTLVFNLLTTDSVLSPTRAAAFAFAAGTISSLATLDISPAKNRNNGLADLPVMY